MTAYKQALLDQAQLVLEAEEAQAKGYITKEELAAVKKAHIVKIYQPNIFIRLGLFIATFIIALAATGLFMLGTNNDSGLTGILIFFSIGSYVALELFVMNKKHWGSGVDEALMVLCIVFMIASVIIANNLGGEPTTFCLIILIPATWMAFRFINVLMTVTAFFSLMALIFIRSFENGGFWQAVLPFTIILISAGLYFFSKITLRMERARHFKYPLQVLMILSLLALYAGGNYFIVREVSEEAGMQMRFGIFFWIWTVIIPISYIFFGIRLKDAILLRIGLLLMAAIVSTIEYYHELIPVEGWMVLGGAFMIALARFVTVYLRKPKHGFTIEADDRKDIMGDQLEAIAIAETFHDTGNAPKGFDFGGGSGMGGGASGNF